MRIFEIQVYADVWGEYKFTVACRKFQDALRQVRRLLKNVIGYCPRHRVKSIVELATLEN